MKRPAADGSTDDSMPHDLDGNASNDFFGLINADGEEVLPPLHRSLYWIYDDGSKPGEPVYYPYLIVRPHGSLESKLFSLQDRSFVGTYSLINQYASEGLLAVQSNNQYGYLDLKNGAQVKIPLAYDDAGVFKEGLSPVKQQNQWGFIDAEGKVVIDFQYDEVSGFKKGAAIVQKDGKAWLINSQNMALSNSYDYISPNYLDIPEQDPLFTFELGDQQGCLDNHGQEVVAPQEAGTQVMCTHASKGYVVIEKNNLYGLMMPNANGGELKLPLQYISISLDPTPELIAVRDGDNIDLLHDETLSPAIEGLQSLGLYSEDRLPVMQGNLWGFTSGQGEWVISPEHKGINYPIGFTNGWACVLNISQKGFIDVQGNPLVIPENQNKSFVFESCTHFDENGIARVTQSGWDSFGYLRSDGTFLWKPE